MSLPEFYLDRVLTQDDASALMGEMVSARPATISEAGIYRDRATQEAVLVYAPHPGDTPALRRAVMDASMSTTLRSAGMRNKSRTFGMTKRSVVLKRESCRPSSLAWENPAAQIVLNATARALGDYLREVLPEVYEQDEHIMEQVLPEWRMTEDSLWTSGVINQSSQLPYHRDRANFETWSAMPVVRRGMDGGDLHMPEYGITIACKDGWAIWFNGFRYLHGVTPMTKRKTDGYRYSIVFYAMRGMKDCHTYAVEIGQARANRTRREAGMLDSSLEAISHRITNGRATGSVTIDPRKKAD